MTITRDTVAAVTQAPPADPVAPGPFRYADAGTLVDLLTGAVGTMLKDRTLDPGLGAVMLMLPAPPWSELADRLAGFWAPNGTSIPARSEPVSTGRD